METQRCEYCGRVAPVAGGKWPNGLEIGFHSYDSYDRPEGEVSVAFVADPFADDVHDDQTPHWLCERCWYDSSMEI